MDMTSTSVTVYVDPIAWDDFEDMKFTDKELAIYISTLASILDLMENMPNPTVKKIKALIREEIESMKDAIKKQTN